MKANRWTRVLAALDEALAAILGLETWLMTPGSQGAARAKSFWIGWGRRFAILNSNGEIKLIGYSWQVEHLFDHEGYLIERTRYVKLLKPGDRVVYGYARVYNLWYAQYPEVALPAR